MRAENVSGDKVTAMTTKAGNFLCFCVLPYPPHVWGLFPYPLSLLQHRRNKALSLCHLLKIT
jgi:hypothetical protein